MARKRRVFEEGHGRKLMVIVDESPEVELALFYAAGRVLHAGGSVLLLQQWEHDATAWDSLPVAEQEQIMGRRKADGAELDPAPETSHVGRTDQEDFGKIFRRNVAYGTLASHGTIFVGFCRDQRILQAMLESMIGRRAEAIDRLTSFTRPLTGAYYMIPSADALAARGPDRRTEDPEGP